MKYSASKENYIKAIFHLQQELEQVSTNSLAEALETAPASVTDMLKKLKAQQLLQYERYRGVRLTASGKKLAIQIIRKHRLWELFLVEKLQFGWEEVHDIAEELEHISSTKLVDRLDEFLGFPKADPHGDPIPDMQGRIPALRQSTVSEMPESGFGRVSGIGDQSPAMLALLRHNHIALGAHLQVRKRFEADRSVEIKLAGHPAVNISEHVAKNIRVTYENNPQ